ENMTLPLLLDGHKVDKKQLEQTVSKLGLGERLNYLPNQLSGGQQQRVSIGRALMANPAVMLADEPTGNLDSKNSEEMMAIVKLFQQAYRQTLIMITHDEQLA